METQGIEQLHAALNGPDVQKYYKDGLYNIRAVMALLGGSFDNSRRAPTGATETGYKALIQTLEQHNSSATLPQMYMFKRVWLDVGNKDVFEGWRSRIVAEGTAFPNNLFVYYNVPNFLTEGKRRAANVTSIEFLHNICLGMDSEYKDKAAAYLAVLAGGTLESAFAVLQQQAEDVEMVEASESQVMANGSGSSSSGMASSIGQAVDILETFRVTLENQRRKGGFMKRGYYSMPVVATTLGFLWENLIRVRSDSSKTFNERLHDFLTGNESLVELPEDLRTELTKRKTFIELGSEQELKKWEQVYNANPGIFPAKLFLYFKMSGFNASGQAVPVSSAAFIHNLIHALDGPIAEAYRAQDRSFMQLVRAGDMSTAAQVANHAVANGSQIVASGSGISSSAQQVPNLLEAVHSVLQKEKRDGNLVVNGVYSLRSLLKAFGTNLDNVLRIPKAEACHHHEDVVEFLKIHDRSMPLPQSTLEKCRNFTRLWYEAGSEMEFWEWVGRMGADGLCFPNNLFVYFKKVGFNVTGGSSTPVTTLAIFQRILQTLHTRPAKDYKANKDAYMNRIFDGDLQTVQQVVNHAIAMQEDPNLQTEQQRESNEAFLANQQAQPTVSRQRYSSLYVRGFDSAMLLDVDAANALSSQVIKFGKTLNLNQRDSSYKHDGGRWMFSVNLESDQVTHIEDILRAELKPSTIGRSFEYLDVEQLRKALSLGNLDYEALAEQLFVHILSKVRAYYPEQAKNTGTKYIRDGDLIKQEPYVLAIEPKQEEDASQKEHERKMELEILRLEDKKHERETEAEVRKYQMQLDYKLALAKLQQRQKTQRAQPKPRSNDMRFSNADKDALRTEMCAVSANCWNNKVYADQDVPDSWKPGKKGVPRSNWVHLSPRKCPFCLKDEVYGSTRSLNKHLYECPDNNMSVSAIKILQ